MNLITAYRVIVDAEGYDHTSPVLINLDAVAYVRTTATGDDYRPVIHFTGGNLRAVTLDESYDDFVERIAAVTGTNTERNS